MRVGRFIVGAVVGLAIIGGGTAGGLKLRDNIATSQKCEAIKPQRAVVHVVNSGPKIAILGDSYTSGDGLGSRAQGWAYRVGTDLAGVGNTGFVNGGYCGSDSFEDRIAGVLALAPETLIIQGGLNDVRDAGKVAAAADALLSRATRVPHVVVVGPPDVPSRDGEAAVDAALKHATEAHGAQYISALHWELEFLPDNTHLTAASHEKFSQLVAAAIH